MSESSIARALMAIGVTVGIGAVGLTALEIPLNLPDWLVRVAMLKLAVLGSIGLLAAGALLGRHARSRSLPGEDSVSQLGAGSAGLPHSTRSKVPERADLDAL